MQELSIWHLETTVSPKKSSFVKTVFFLVPTSFHQGNDLLIQCAILAVKLFEILWNNWHWRWVSSLKLGNIIHALPDWNLITATQKERFYVSCEWRLPGSTLSIRSCILWCICTPKHHFTSSEQGKTALGHSHHSWCWNEKQLEFPYTSAVPALQTFCLWPIYWTWQSWRLPVRTRQKIHLTGAVFLVFSTLWNFLKQK